MCFSNFHDFAREPFFAHGTRYANPNTNISYRYIYIYMYTYIYIYILVWTRAYTCTGYWGLEFWGFEFCGIRVSSYYHALLRVFSSVLELSRSI